jgi:hypothetical protein
VLQSAGTALFRADLLAFGADVWALVRGNLDMAFCPRAFLDSGGGHVDGVAMKKCSDVAFSAEHEIHY